MERLQILENLFISSFNLHFRLHFFFIPSFTPDSIIILIIISGFICSLFSSSAGLGGGGEGPERKMKKKMKI